MLVPDEVAVRPSEDTGNFAELLHGQKHRSYQITSFTTDMTLSVAIEA
jgi:hypothetical protein